MGRGSCPVLSPFLGCLSGSSGLDWGSVELLRTSEVRFSDSESALHPGLCLGWAHWVFHAMSFCGSFQGLGWGVLCFRPGLRGEDSGPLLPCSSVCGLHCTGPTNARYSQWETVISCAGGQVLLVPLGLRIVRDASSSFLPQGVA